MKRITYTVKYWWLTGNTGYCPDLNWALALKTFKQLLAHQAIAKVEIIKNITVSVRVRSQKTDRK